MFNILSVIYLDHDLLLCDNICCTNSQHLTAIDHLCSAVTTGLSDASIAFSCESKPMYNQIEGWNELCKIAHSEAREAFLFLCSHNKPWGLEAYIKNVYYEFCWPMYTDLGRPGDTFAVAGNRAI